MKRILQIVMSIAIVLAIVYMLGPKSKIEDLSGEYPEVPTSAHGLITFIQAKQDSVIGLKPNNEARIIWADSSMSKTPVSFLYIHGFGASQMEGDPVHQEIAAHFGGNVYLLRLPEHGIDRPDAFRHLTANRLLDEVREAYQIAKQLGDEVVVIGTSMGGALTLTLASEQPDIKAILLYSPAVREYGDALEIFFKPWLAFLAENFQYPNGVLLQEREGDKAKYWSTQYHINSYRSLAVLLRSKMTQETFEKIHQPLFLAYYYKNEEEQDKVVSVPDMMKMYEQVSTPDNLKVEKAFPESGDHVIASSITSEDWEGVLEESIRFLEEVVGLQPVVLEEVYALEGFK